MVGREVLEAAARATEAETGAPTALPCVSKREKESFAVAAALPALTTVADAITVAELAVAPRAGRRRGTIVPEVTAQTAGAGRCC